MLTHVSLQTKTTNSENVCKQADVSYQFENTSCNQLVLDLRKQELKNNQTASILSIKHTVSPFPP